MHMADALISPQVGGVMLAAAVGAAAYSVRKTQDDMDEKKIPLMGVMGAFIFAAQMINFTIPGTGSSGHLGGGLLLAAVLGPYAGFLTMASVLLIQALFFGDGGLLAYGCNVINLGFWTCFVAYPLIYRRLARKGLTRKRIFAASMAAAVTGLQLGAFSVVLETFFSGKTELHFMAFLLLMQPIHLAIGVVEGLVTSALLAYVWQARPEILENAAGGEAATGKLARKVLASLLVAAVLTGGFVSWFASTKPDGLEWSVQRAAGTAELEEGDRVHGALAALQGATAILPDYGFKAEQGAASNAGTSVSGIAGGMLTLALAGLTGISINLFKKRKKTCRR